ncbi:hypothetical protein B0H13DRAFT_1910233 [Mycena leptocephala]|nr:hypothetical protein B0H13DRAFT_1910233 [Mycena leptocephala]
MMDRRRSASEVEKPGTRPRTIRPIQQAGIILMELESLGEAKDAVKSDPDYGNDPVNKQVVHDIHSQAIMVTKAWDEQRDNGQGRDYSPSSSEAFLKIEEICDGCLPSRRRLQTLEISTARKALIITIRSYVWEHRISPVKDQGGQQIQCGN